MKRIGILTSGGDCPGLNAVIRGAVKSCHHLGYDCVGFLKGYEGLYDPVQYVHLTQKNTEGILNRGGTILGSTNKGRFAATVGVQDRVELDPELINGVKETINQLSIDGLICVGGDGSLAVAQQFHENGIPVVGVPKTIDNDLSATAFTFGFDSAIECATDALDRLHTTAASHERIMVLEVMGRHAGWIALHAGIAGGGDVILIPEVEWDFEHVCHKILHRESQGKKFTLIVVAEGAELPGGALVGEQVEGQQMKLGGVGRAVVEEIERKLHREARLCVLGHLQRGGNPTTFDRVLATQFGAHAVRLIKEERFGEMICSQPPEMTSVPIMEAVNVLRQVDPNGPAVQAARALGISFGDRPADGCGLSAFDHPVTDEDAFATEEEVAAFEEELHQVESESESTEVDALEQATSVVAEEVTEEVAEEDTSEPVAEEVAASEFVNEVEDEIEEDTTEEIAETQDAAELTSDFEEDSEDAEAEEEVANEILDMVADADEAVNGSVVELEVEEEEVSTAELTAQESAIDQAFEETSNVEEDNSDSETTEEDSSTVEEATTEKPEETEEVIEENSSESEPASANLEVDLAELVKQKLAIASANFEKEDAELNAAEDDSEWGPSESLASPADSPFEEDLLAEAKSALEEALDNKE